MVQLNQKEVPVHPDLVKLLVVIALMVIVPVAAVAFRWWVEFLDRLFRSD